MNIGFRKIIIVLIAVILCSAFLVQLTNLWLEKDYSRENVEEIGNPNVYVNRRLGFSIEFPYSWAFKYGIYDWDDGITVYKLNSSADSKDKLMVFFGVERINNTFTKEEVEYIESPSKYIMSNNGYTYIWRLPSKEQYPSYGSESSESISEYTKMSESLSQIRGSIKPAESEVSDYSQTQIDIMSERTGINKSYLKSRLTAFYDVPVEKYKLSDSSTGIEFNSEKFASEHGININDYIGNHVDVYLCSGKAQDSCYVFVFEADRLVLYERVIRNQINYAKIILDKLSNSSANDIEYALKRIITSPDYSKGSFAYRPASDTNKTEFNFLVNLGTDTLYYFGRIFARGGQTGVRGRVMEEICRAILSDRDIKYVSRNGQDWFDNYKIHIENVISRAGIDEIKKNNYPGLILVSGYSY